MRTPILCAILRGGTSRGPLCNLADVPSGITTRDMVVLAVIPGKLLGTGARCALPRL